MLKKVCRVSNFIQDSLLLDTCQALAITDCLLLQRRGSSNNNKKTVKNFKDPRAIKGGPHVNVPEELEFSDAEHLTSHVNHVRHF